MALLGISVWWLVCTALGTLFVHVYLVWTHSYWQKRGVPYLQPSLVFGSIKDAYIGKKTLGEVYRDIYWKLDDKRFGGIFKFRQPMIILRDPKLIEMVVNTHFESFHDNDFEVNIKTYPLIGRNPMFLKGLMWNELKHKLTPAFSTEYLKLWFPFIEDICKGFTDYIREQNRKESLHETTDIARKLTVDAVATFAYGVRQNSFQKSETQFRIYCKKFLKPTLRKVIVQLLVFMAPRVANFFGLRIIPTRVTNFFRRRTEEIVSYRHKSNIKQNDYLQFLIELENQVNDLNNTRNKHIPWYKKFTMEDIAAQALTFFTDGYGTTATGLSVLLYHLACNPDVQYRLREEVDSVIEKHGRKLNLDIIQDMKYLEMVVNESLRIHPPIPFMTRLCTKPFDLPTPDGGSLAVNVGTPVVIPVLAIQNDPQYHPNPKKFDPERFTEDNENTRPSCTYLPFGDGPRRCLGMRFALAQNKCCVVSILSKYKIRKCRDTPERITAVPTSFIYVPKQSMWVEFVKRTKK